MHKLLVLFCFLIYASSSHCQRLEISTQKGIDWSLYATDVIVRSYDLKTSYRFLNLPCNGRSCPSEMDPIAPHGKSLGPQILFQYGMSALVIRSSRILERRHHARIARLLLAADILDETVADLHNERLIRAWSNAKQPIELKRITP